MTSEVRGVISWVLFALQISLALRKSLVTLGISSRFIVISCFCVYVSSRTLSLKYHVTLGGGKPPITSHSRNISLPSLNVCNIWARVLLVSIYITGFFGGTVSKLNSDHENLFPWRRHVSVISNYISDFLCYHFLIRLISSIRKSRHLVDRAAI